MNRQSGLAECDVEDVLTGVNAPRHLLVGRERRRQDRGRALKRHRHAPPRWCQPAATSSSSHCVSILLLTLASTSIGPVAAANAAPASRSSSIVRTVTAGIPKPAATAAKSTSSKTDNR